MTTTAEIRQAIETLEHRAAEAEGLAAWLRGQVGYDESEAGYVEPGAIHVARLINGGAA